VPTYWGLVAGHQDPAWLAAAAARALQKETRPANNENEEEDEERGLRRGGGRLVPLCISSRARFCFSHSSLLGRDELNILRKKKVEKVSIKQSVTTLNPK
jgi:hypothetical protein